MAWLRAREASGDPYRDIKTAVDRLREQGHTQDVEWDWTKKGHMDNKPFVNNVERLPITIITGKDNKVQDDKGNWYYDLWGDEGVASMGYGHKFNLAMAEFIGGLFPHRLPEMYHNPIRTSAAQKLADNLRFDRVFFCNSGAEVNEAMIKMARRYWFKVKNEPKKVYIVTLAGNFHGRTGFALAASDSTDSPYHKEGFQPIAEGFGVISEEQVIEAAKSQQEGKDDIWICPNENWAPFVPHDEAEGIPWREIAAIQMAPILGNNVVHTYSKEFWSALTWLRAKHDFLVSFDEVQVANGRTGYHAAYQHPAIDFKPDIIGIGKGLALGLPAAALLTTDEVGQAFSPGVHFSTFGGTIVVCWMILKLQEYLADNLGRIRDLEQQLRAGFKERAWIKQFDGLGIHWGFTPDWDLLDNITGQVFCERARDFGLLMVTHRPKGCIRFTPPLTITKEEIEDIFNKLDQTARSLVVMSVQKREPLG